MHYYHVYGYDARFKIEPRRRLITPESVYRYQRQMVPLSKDISRQQSRFWPKSSRTIKRMGRGLHAELKRMQNELSAGATQQWKPVRSWMRWCIHAALLLLVPVFGHENGPTEYLLVVQRHVHIKEYSILRWMLSKVRLQSGKMCSVTACSPPEGGM